MDCVCHASGGHRCLRRPSPLAPSSAPVTRSSSGHTNDSSLFPSERRKMEAKRAKKAELIARTKAMREKKRLQGA